MTVSERTRLELEEGARQNRIRRNRALVEQWKREGKLKWICRTDRLVVGDVELKTRFDDKGNPDDETIGRIVLAMSANGIEPTATEETEADRIRREGNCGKNNLQGWKGRVV